MNCFTHMAGGALCGLLLATSNQLEDPTIVVGVSVLGSLLPDIDIGTSKIAGICRPAAYVAQFLFGHRGLFHSPLLWICLGWFTSGRFPKYSSYILAAVVGVASHLLLDIFNPSGIPLFWPLPTRISLARVRTGSLFDFLIGLFLFVIACFVLISNNPFPFNILFR